MQISIVVVGGRQPNWVQEATKIYLHRLQTYLPTELIEIPLAKGGRVRSSNARQHEGQAILRKLPEDARVIALDVGGSPLTTEQLAKRLDHWKQDRRNCYLLIGGPDGLDDACFQRSDERLSLSPLTFAHGLARVVLLEALYRAATVGAGHPYHRG